MAPSEDTPHGAGLYPPHRTADEEGQARSYACPPPREQRHQMTKWTVLSLPNESEKPHVQAFISPCGAHPRPRRCQVRGGLGSTPWVPPRLQLECGSSFEPHPTSGSWSRNPGPPRHV